MNQEPSNSPLCAAIKERGRIYLAVFRELSKRYGEAEAVSVMRCASRERGEDVGKAVARYAPRDFAGVAAFWAGPPEEEAAFSPAIRRLDDDGLEMKMMSCPLKQSWVEAGCSDAEICTLLHCASAFDEAVFETAGFDHELELWAPGKEGCCLTRLSEKARPDGGNS